MKRPHSNETLDLIKFSREVALSLGFDYISTLHFFIADCIANDNNAIKQIVFKNEEDFNTFLNEQNIGKIDFNEYKEKDIPLTVEAEHAITDAEEQRKYFGQKETYPSHIFIAALKNKESLISKTFFNTPNLLFRVIRYYSDKGQLTKIKNQEVLQNPIAKTKVFVSYSHFDKKFLDELKRHFKPLASVIEFWDDSKINAGEKWNDEIKIAIEAAKIAILLISADFFNSDFITTNELPRLLEKAENEGTTILSIILKPCLFEEFPQINKYQTVNNPTQPISSLDETAKELAWVETVRKIKKIMSS